jgi:hypothetical protein
VAGAGAGDFVGDFGDVDFGAEAPFGIAQAHASVQIVGADAPVCGSFHVV